jgi:serine/threonine-protein kinase RsbW
MTGASGCRPRDMNPVPTGTGRMRPGRDAREQNRNRGACTMTGTHSHSKGRVRQHPDGRRPPTSEPRATFRSRCAPESVGPARAWLRGNLSWWTDDTDAIDAATLCLSELVSNVVNHTVTRVVTVDVRRVEGLADRLLLAVHDDGRTGDVTPGPVSEASSSGRGLHILAALADDWGHHPVPGGTCVWCVLATDG